MRNTHYSSFTPKSKCQLIIRSYLCFFPNQSKILTGMNKEPNSVARRRYRWYLKGAQTQDSGTGAGAGGLRSGCKAFTTILMLGLNSDSYCTHNAATAASCIAHITDS